MEDITDKFLKGSSWYIHDYIYYIKERKLIISMLKNIDKQDEPCKNIIFTDVYDFKDETLDIDDDCIDSIIGAHRDSAGTFCIRTDQREVSFKTKNELTIKNLCAFLLFE